MKRKNVVLISVLVILTIMCIILTFTLAKYMQTVSGKDSARVAKFEYSVKQGENAFTAETAAIDIFATMDDTGVLGTNDRGLDGKKLIAPGTTGSFDIEVSNLSEVAVSDTFVLTEVNTNNVPIVYTFDSKNYSSAFVDVATKVGDYTLTGNLNAMAQAISDKNIRMEPDSGVAEVKTYAISWNWAFSSNDIQTDTKDTALGIKAVTEEVNVSLTVDCTITQID